MANAEIRKAAILLMSLPEEQAAQLLGKLEPKQVEAVSIEIAKISGISGDEQEAVIQDFASANPAGLTGRAGGLEVAKNLVERALGKGAGATLDNVRQSIEALPFGFLQKVDSQNLLTFIIDEHPQTIALILSPPAAAAGRRDHQRAARRPPDVGHPPRGHHGPDQPGDHQGGGDRAWSTACRA